MITRRLSVKLCLLVIVLNIGGNHSDETTSSKLQGSSKFDRPAAESSSNLPVGKGARTIGTYKLIKDNEPSCVLSGRGKADCRRKRSTISSSTSPSGSELTLRLDLDEPSVLGSSHSTVSIRLKRSPELLAPNFKLVIRDGDHVFENKTVPYPVCLYRGVLPDSGHEVAVSTCQKHKLKGIIKTSDKALTVEEISSDHADYPVSSSRPRRQADDSDGHIVVYESGIADGECGIKPKNLERMRAPVRPAVLLKTDQADQVNEEETTGNEKASTSTKSTGPGAFVRRRRKRSNADQKAIELAVFVDDDLYQLEVDSGVDDPIQDIQDVVFTYLNSVQLLYSSRILDVRFRIVLVRLEIFRSRVRSVDKSGGEIERYLDSFCGWQEDQNPGSSRNSDADSDEPGHWDHGLMLTGLNLYDQEPQYDTVIGLAWVSGMCHPAYSCTINEGRNFESVYVIAHEMGHNLGMNHDGETREGNNCDPDRYLMSPILGPGKVTWSSCSNDEVNRFLTNRATRSQAECLNDMPDIVDGYDYLKENVLPGEKFTAMEQCQRAFGRRFVPHVKPDESPFDDLCRELWCANSSHALRAHPALEGTDCSSRPYPYGSTCWNGVCTAFDPNLERRPQSDDDDDDAVSATTNGDESGGSNEEVKDRPQWYDPLFTKAFESLRIKVSEKYPNENGQRRVLPLKSLRREGAIVEFTDANFNTRDSAKWTMMTPECPVQCGGGWANVQMECTRHGELVQQDQCDQESKPKMTRTTCNINPCKK